MISYLRRRQQDKKGMTTISRNEKYQLRMRSIGFEARESDTLVFENADAVIRLIQGNEEEISDIHILFINNDKQVKHSVRAYYEQYQSSLGVPYHLDDHQPDTVLDELFQFLIRNADDFTNEDFCIRMTLAYIYQQDILT